MMFEFGMASAVRDPLAQVVVNNVPEAELMAPRFGGIDVIETDIGATTATCSTSGR
jgi:hypothetical protein